MVGEGGLVATACSVQVCMLKQMNEINHLCPITLQIIKVTLKKYIYHTKLYMLPCNIH